MASRVRGSQHLLGGYLVGIAVAFFAGNTSLPPEWRLFAITGFLGGLTTFSTFSAEVVTQLTEGRIAWALATVLVHVLGSVTLTLLGIGTAALVRNARLAGG
jgi:CrcB protein